MKRVEPMNTESPAGPSLRERMDAVVVENRRDLADLADKLSKLTTSEELIKFADQQIEERRQRELEFLREHGARHTVEPKSSL